MGKDLEDPGFEGIHYSADTNSSVSCVTDLIWNRAYELFEARGHNHGHQVTNGRLPQPATFLDQDWRDWIIVHALQSEAKQRAAGRLPAVELHDSHLSDALKWEAEAGIYAEDHKTNKAKAAFAKALAIRQQYLDDEPPGPFTMNTIMDFLIEATPNDAAELLNRIAMPALPGYSDLRSRSADLFQVPFGLAAYQQSRDQRRHF
jgi:hypothetical protein